MGKRKARNGEEQTSTPEKQARSETSDVKEWDMVKVGEFLADLGLDSERIQPFIGEYKCKAVFFS